MGYASETPSQAFAALAQAAQARKTGQASKQGRQARLLFSCLLAQADAPKAVKHSGREGMVQRYLSGVSCSV